MRRHDDDVDVGVDDDVDVGVDDGGDVGGGSHSPPTTPGLDFSLPACKVGVGICNLSERGKVGHLDQDQVPAPGLTLSHCTDMRSDWDRAPDS